MVGYQQVIRLRASPLRNSALGWLMSDTLIQQVQKGSGSVKEHHCLQDLRGAFPLTRTGQCLNARRNEVDGVG